ncbi:hypothetical protein CVT26_005589 [Gymnopilus dilepis]|uniref:YDG domain-containing protein n=1 Tax=Gymnopilus dilepis TaxID=231916 RepID=A0A409XZT1_9AGAR|nr:hypothetical protein CVT26_005589 [Gymnopilus dilepis]
MPQISDSTPALPLFRHHQYQLFMSRPESEAKLHYGEIPGFPVGYHWPDRKQLAKSKVHAALWAGIQGNMVHGARSIVLSGVFEDDEDLGGRPELDNKRGSKGKQTKDQDWNAGANRWLKAGVSSATQNIQMTHPYHTFTGIPFVLFEAASSTRDSHLSGGRHLIPQLLQSLTLGLTSTSYRYDGLYKVVDCSKDRGKSGHNVCLFKLKRISGQPPIPTRWPDTSRANIVRRIAQPTLPSPSGSGSGSGSSSQSNSESEASDTSRTSRNSTNTGGYTGSDLKTAQHSSAGPSIPSNGLQHTSRTSSSTNGAGRHSDVKRVQNSNSSSLPSGSSRTAQVHRDQRQQDQVRVGVVKEEPSDRNSTAMDVS